jgi:hypothetical protein
MQKRESRVTKSLRNRGLNSCKKASTRAGLTHSLARQFSGIKLRKFLNKKKTR